MHSNSVHGFNKIHYIVVLFSIYLIGLTKTTENYFTSNSENFESVPTTIKTYENDTVLLPCYTVGKFQLKFQILRNISISSSFASTHTQSQQIIWLFCVFVSMKYRIPLQLVYTANIQFKIIRN